MLDVYDKEKMQQVCDKLNYNIDEVIAMIKEWEEDEDVCIVDEEDTYSWTECYHEQYCYDEKDKMLETNEFWYDISYHDDFHDVPQFFIYSNVINGMRRKYGYKHNDDKNNQLEQDIKLWNICKKYYNSKTFKRTLEWDIHKRLTQEEFDKHKPNLNNRNIFLDKDILKFLYNNVVVNISKINNLKEYKWHINEFSNIGWINGEEFVLSHKIDKHYKELKKLIDSKVIR